MENLINLAISVAASFLVAVIKPEFKELAAAVRKAIKTMFKKPFETFTVLSLCIILAGVIKLAFLGA